MTDERITAYLLQELTEEEAEQFEEECFVQEEWPAELDSAEQDLIDAYLRNQLSNDRRRRFENNYLTSDARKARVLTAQSFLRIVCPAPPQKVTLSEYLQAFFARPLVPQTAVAILVVALGLSLLWPLIRGGRLPQTFTPVHLAISSSERGPGVQPQKVEVTLPLSTDALEIHLKLPERLPDAVDYRVQWENVSRTLGDLKIKSQDAQSVVVIIPAADLSPGDYALKLFAIKRDGTEQAVDGSYFFTAKEAARTR